MRKMIAVLALLVLAGCGSSPLAPTPPPTTMPTPAPVSHSGSYTGSAMTYSSDIGTLEGNRGTTTVTQDRELLIFSDMRLTHAGGLDFSFRLGSAVLDSTDHFTGVSSYSSSGCGTVTVRTGGWFAGDFMNFTAALSSQSCAPVDVRGEMRR